MTSTREYLVFTVQAVETSPPDAPKPTFNETWGLLKLTDTNNLLDRNIKKKFSSDFITELKESLPNLTIAIPLADRPPNSDVWYDTIGTNIEPKRD